MTQELEQKDDQDVIAISEGGKPVQHTERTVNTSLKLLAMKGGNIKDTVSALEEEGLDINRETLRRWKQQAFPRRYQQFRNELGQEITAETAARLYERALESDEATRLYIEKALEKLDKVDPTHLAKNVQSLAAATAQSVQTAELLRGKPTQIVEHRSLEDMVGTLEKLGVAEREKPKVIDVEAEEIE